MSASLEWLPDEQRAWLDRVAEGAHQDVETVLMVVIKPNIDGIDLPNVFFMRWIDDALKFDDYVKQKMPKRVVVVGGGYIGLEMAEALIRRGLRVTLIEFADRILTTVDRE